MRIVQRLCSSQPSPWSSLSNARAFILLAVLGCLGFGLEGCSTVGQHLVIPDRDQGRDYAVLPPSSDYELVTLHTRAGTRIIAQFGKAQGRDPANSPTVIFFYGSAQTIACPHNQNVCQLLRMMGVNVLTPEYPGHGMSEGRASEAECYATADAALDYLLTRPDVNPCRIVAAGQSRGSGVATDLAARRPIAGLVLVAPVTNTADAAKHVIPWMPGFVAKSLTADCRFDNLTRLRAVRCPVLIVYGERDRMLPPADVEKLVAAPAGSVTRHSVPYSDHNSLWRSPTFGLDRSVADWLRTING